LNGRRLVLHGLSQLDHRLSCVLFRF
jgi:hypothetical protein